MAELPVTLVHDTKRPSQVVAHSRRALTQLKSQGYRVVDDQEAAPVGYEAMSKAQMTEEIRARNEAKAEAGLDQLPVTGTKADLIAALNDDDKSEEPAQ